MANRFWLGGTGNWDGTTTSSAHWGTASGGGTTPTTGPGASDAAIFDANSGGGTVTITGDITCQSITCGAFTGTLDNNANNKNVTLSAATGFNGSGTGTRTINLGNGTWNLTSNTAGWTMTTTTNLTFNANNSTIQLSAAVSSAARSFAGGGLTYHDLAITGAVTIAGTNTFNTLTINAGSQLRMPVGATQTAAAIVSNGTPASPASIFSSSTTLATLSIAGGTQTIQWAGITLMTFTGGATFLAPNSLDLGGNTGITITPPSWLVNPGMSGGMAA